MNAKLYAIDGSEKGTAALPDDLFAQPVHEHLMWLAVKRHLGNQRQGTAKVKTRGEVSGGAEELACPLIVILALAFCGVAVTVTLVTVVNTSTV